MDQQVRERRLHMVSECAPYTKEIFRCDGPQTAQFAVLTVYGNLLPRSQSTAILKLDMSDGDPHFDRQQGEARTMQGTPERRQRRSTDPASGTS